MTRRTTGTSAGLTDFNLFGLLAVTLLQKIVVIWQIKGAPSVGPNAGLDTTAYVELARRVLAGDFSLGPGLYYVSPFYIYFLAGALWLTKSFTAVRLAQAVLGTAAVGGMFVMTREWFGTRAAWCAAILASVTSLFTFYEVLILQTSIDVAFTTGALVALTFGLKRRHWHWLALAGLLFGLESLNRPNIAISTAALIALCAVWRHRRVALFLALGFFAGLAPATIRNAVVSHEFSLLSSHGGINFYIGNGAGATGLYHEVPGIRPTIVGQQSDVRNVASAALGRAVTDAEASDYFVNRALAWMSEHPGDSALLFAKKLALVFHAQHVPLPYSLPFYQYDWPTWLRFQIVGPWLLVPLGLVGLVLGAPRARDARAAYMIWAAFVPFYAVAVALFFMSERYRLPLLVPLVCASGATIDALITRIRAHDFRAVAAPAVIIALLMTGVTVHTIAGDGRWEEGLRLMQQYVITRDYDKAEAWLAKLKVTEPKPGMAEEGIAMQMLALGQGPRAVPHFQAAAAANPSRAIVQYSLGQALLRAGDTAGALPYLERGFNAGVDITTAGYDLAQALKDAGRTDDAVKVLRKISIGREASIDDWLSVGRLANELKAPEAGEPYFRTAVERWPSSADARLQYGVNLNVLGRFADANTQLSNACRLDPRNASALAQWAFAEARLGRIDEARAHTAAALAIDPTEPLARQLAAALK